MSKGAIPRKQNMKRYRDNFDDIFNGNKSLTNPEEESDEATENRGDDTDTNLEPYRPDTTLVDKELEEFWYDYHSPDD